MVERAVLKIEHNQPLSKIAKYLGHVYLEPSSVEAGLKFVLENTHSATTYVNTVQFNTTDAIKVLDNGAAKVIVSQGQLNQICQESLLQDLGRLVVAYEGPLSQVSESIKSIAAISSNVCIYLSGVETIKTLKEAKVLSGLSKVYVSLKENTEEVLRETIAAGLVPIVPSSLIIEVNSTGHTSLSPETLFLSALKTDRSDGLYSTIVCDERGVTLGLVYSSAESIRESLKTGRGVYQSRERGLWYKGETSGDVQELVKVGLDCDGDALLFTVKQEGQGKRGSHYTYDTYVLKGSAT